MKSFISNVRSFINRDKMLTTAFLVFSLVFVAGAVSASTTISTDINTQGQLSVTGTSTLLGNVGIGTTSQSSFLTVQGTSTTATLGTEMITATADQDLSSDTTNWSGTGWSIGSGVDTHVAGANALTLNNTALTSAPVAGISIK